MQNSNTIPTPGEVKRDAARRNKARIEAACDILRPVIVEAMNAGLDRVSLHAALSGEAVIGTMFSSTKSETLPGSYLDVSEEAACVLIEEINAAGWSGARVYGGDLYWEHPPECAEDKAL